MEQDVIARRAATVRERWDPASAAGGTGQRGLRRSRMERGVTPGERPGLRALPHGRGSARVLDWLQRKESLLPTFPKSLLNELNHPLPGIEPMPRLPYRRPVHSLRQRPVILTRVSDQLNRHTHLPQRAIHLLRLAYWVSRVRFPLQEHKGRSGMRGSRKRALPPGIFRMFPGLPVKPAVVKGAALGSVLAVLIDHRSAADNRLKARGLAFDETGHLAAIAVTFERQPVRIDGLG